MWNKPTQERLEQIPRLYETEHVSLQDKLIHLHFFIGGCDWFVAEYDGGDLFWGFAILNQDYDMAEWGYFTLSELAQVNIGGIEVDCELPQYWNIRPASDIETICKAQRWPYQKRQKEVTNATSPVHDPEGNLGSDARSRAV